MNDDLISRQAAIDAIENAFDRETILNRFVRKIAISAVRMLPSAQPEIIRCKECKHSEHWYKGKRRCFLWAEDGIDVFDDGYCNYADMKEGQDG